MPETISYKPFDDLNEGEQQSPNSEFLAVFQGQNGKAIVDCAAQVLRGNGIEVEALYLEKKPDEDLNDELKRVEGFPKLGYTIFALPLFDFRNQVRRYMAVMVKNVDKEKVCFLVDPLGEFEHTPNDLKEELGSLLQPGKGKGVLAGYNFRTHLKTQTPAGSSNFNLNTAATLVELVMKDRNADPNPIKQRTQADEERLKKLFYKAYLDFNAPQHKEPTPPPAVSPIPDEPSPPLVPDSGSPTASSDPALSIDPTPSPVFFPPISGEPQPPLVPDSGSPTTSADPVPSQDPPPSPKPLEIEPQVQAPLPSKRPSITPEQREKIVQLIAKLESEREAQVGVKEAKLKALRQLSKEPTRLASDMIESVKASLGESSNKVFAGLRSRARNLFSSWEKMHQRPNEKQEQELGALVQTLEHEIEAIDRRSKKLVKITALKELLGKMDHNEPVQQTINGIIKQYESMGLLAGIWRSRTKNLLTDLQKNSPEVANDSDQPKPMR